MDTERKNQILCQESARAVFPVHQHVAQPLQAGGEAARLPRAASGQLRLDGWSLASGPGNVIPTPGLSDYENLVLAGRRWGYQQKSYPEPDANLDIFPGLAV